MMPRLLLLGPLLAGLMPGFVQAQEIKPIEKQIVQLTNQFRKGQKLDKLEANAELLKIAQAHARNMARQDKYGDTDKDGHVLDGKGPADRVKAGGYQYVQIAENVGYTHGFANPGKVAMEGWEKSPGHRKNLMTKEFTDIGVGAAQGRSGRWYFVQVFGRPISQATKVAVEIDNRTGKTIHFRVEDKQYELGPGFMGKYWCTKAAGPVILTVTWPGSNSGEKLTLRDGMRYAFVQKAGAFAIQTLGLMP